MKLGFPTTAPMIGMMMSFTKLLTNSPNAMPMITATARSSTLPFVMNFLKSASMCVSFVVVAGQ